MDEVRRYLMFVLDYYLPALALLFCLALPWSCLTIFAKVKYHLCKVQSELPKICIFQSSNPILTSYGPEIVTISVFYYNVY